jgi:hypothetical protein
MSKRKRNDLDPPLNPAKSFNSDYAIIDLDKVQPSTMSTISKAKLEQYETGFYGRNKFEKEREASEKRKQEEQAQAQKLYVDFVRDFGSDDKPGIMKYAQTFVRGSTLVPSSEQAQQQELDKDKTRLYRPALAPEDIPKSTQEPQSSKRKDIDLLLEELKQEKRQTNSIGQQDSDDLNSTNVFVSNLSLTVTEEDLFREFERFGPIASIKIMYPRSEEHHSRQRITGFVCFMQRESAEKAIIAAQDLYLDGQKLRVGWGKRLPLPREPMRNPRSTTTYLEKNLIHQKDDIYVKVPTDDAVLSAIHELAQSLAKKSNDAQQHERGKLYSRFKLKNISRYNGARTIKSSILISVP